MSKKRILQKQDIETTLQLAEEQGCEIIYDLPKDTVYILNPDYIFPKLKFDKQI